MRVLTSLLLPILAIAAPAVAQAPAWQPTIPAKFHGEWAPRLADCNSRGGENTGGITVSAREISHYEESETIKRVRATSATSISYQAVLETSEGSQPITGALRLSPDGARLLGAGYAAGPGRKAPDLLRCGR